MKYKFTITLILILAFLVFAAAVTFNKFKYPLILYDGANEEGGATVAAYDSNSIHINQDSVWIKLFDADGDSTMWYMSGNIGGFINIAIDNAVIGGTTPAAGRRGACPEAAAICIIRSCSAHIPSKLARSFWRW